jgi:hypothetical protein
VPKSENDIDKKDLKVCIICERPCASGDYCKYHADAYQNVMQYYDEWKEAYGELSFKEYLQKVIDNPATGIWACEVSEKLLEKEKSQK